MRLKKILAESKVVGIPFPFISPNQNGDGVVDERDLKAIEARRAAVVRKLQERLSLAEITGGFDPPPSTDNSPEGVPSDAEEDAREQHMAKAELLSIHKKAGELYNMVSEDEQVEGWMEEKITKCMNDINSIHNALSYEKSKPMSIGNGEGAPADLARPAV